jgi:hypothetical protein
MPDAIYQRFRQQRKTAKQRGIPWRLEYWEWLQIWQDSGHLNERGRGADEWVMARNADQGAYETGNVKIIYASSNSSFAQLQRHARRRREAHPCENTSGPILDSPDQV